MPRGRRIRRLLLAGFVMACPVLSTGPAWAAAPCTGANCYRYYADITITAWTTPSWGPVFPGSTHSYTVRVTNTGWRVGGNSAPTPGLGPASGPVYVGFAGSPEEIPLSVRYDSGEHFRCMGSYPGYLLACDTISIPTGTTSQFTVYVQAPRTLGPYTCEISAYAFNWTEYDPGNNAVTLTYTVGYPA